MSEVVVDTGLRATPTCKLEDGLPYSEVVHYWGEVGVPMKALLTPRHGQDRARADARACDVRDTDRARHEVACPPR